MVKYLIIRFSSIGDIVLTTPVIRCLKQQVPEAEVHFLTKKAFQNVLSENPFIDKVFAFDKSLSDIMPALKAENYDYIIDLHNNLRTAIVKTQIGAISFTVDKLNFKKWLLINFKINLLPNKHIVDRYLDTVKVFDVVNDNKGLDFFYNIQDEFNRDDLPDSHKNGYVAFIIGAKHNTKKLPLEKIVSIIKKMKLPVILIGGKEDINDGNWIFNKCGKICLDYSGKFRLGQSASIVKQAKVVITHDTGLMHIAAAFHKKIISVWGNTIPDFGMYPYLIEDSKIVEVNNLKCRPCSKIGYSACPQKHFKCMNMIDENLILKYALELFKN